jgi:hypothetical protein
MVGLRLQLAALLCVLITLAQARDRPWMNLGIDKLRYLYRVSHLFRANNRNTSVVFRGFLHNHFLLLLQSQNNKKR